MKMIALLGLLLGGCATMQGARNDSELAKISVGASKSEVESTLGRPNLIAHTATGTSWVYAFGSADEEREVRIDFADSKVTQVQRFDAGREPAAESVVEGTIDSGRCLNPWSRMNDYQSTCRK
jgi:outer membrane protein assembly factor BamE (lipoprotein component of BamABCDE complex)